MERCSREGKRRLLGAAFVIESSNKANILVTVGTQFAFDRLTDMVQQWMKNENIADNSVYFQVGPEGKSPEKSPHCEFMSPHDYQKVMKTVQVVVAHAGIGSILSAIENGKAVIIVPRDFDLGEHRNAHQTSTAREFAQRPGIYVATDYTSLARYLNQRESLQPALPAELDAQMLASVDDFIQGRR